MAIQDPSILAPEKFFDGDSIKLDPSLFTKSGFTPVKENFLLKEHSVYKKRFDIKKGTRAVPETKHEVIFSVKENLDDLKTLVDDISNPFSANFGKHLKRDEVTAMSANPASFHHVMAYLSLHEIEVVGTSPYSEYITAVAPVRKWEELFATEFYEFEMDGEDGKLMRAEKYSLSENLHDHVAAVFNTVQFPPLSRRKVIREKYVKKTPMKPSAATYYGYTDPSLINSVYDIRNNTGNLLSSQAVYETSEEAFSPSDLTIFQQTFGLPIEAVAEDIGGYMLDNACVLYDCGEGNLDVQYIMAVAQNVPTTYYYWNGSDFLLDWVTQVSNMADPPKVISISWGGPEVGYGESYIEAFNTQALKVSAMGGKFILSSLCDPYDCI